MRVLTPCFFAIFLKKLYVQNDNMVNEYLQSIVKIHISQSLHKYNQTSQSESCHE